MTNRNNTLVAIPVEIIPRGPDAIAAALSMRVLERWERRGLSMTLLVRGRPQPEYRSDIRHDFFLRHQ